MRITPFDYEKFSLSKTLSRNVAHHHDIHIGAIPGLETLWYGKKTSGVQEACRNLLSAELFRLICHYPQPQTLIAKNEENEWFLLSEELNDSYVTSDKGELSIEDPGVADILMVSLWVNEVDLKCENILVNQTTGEVAKIDGEWSFHSLLYPQYDHEITARMLKCLPYPDRYPAANWLCFMRENSFVSREFNELNVLPEVFIADKFRAALRISLLPDRFIELLCKNILFSTDEVRFHAFLMERRDQIKRSIMSDPLFVAYLDSKEAMLEARDFLEVLQAFTTQKVQISGKAQHVITNEYIAQCHEVNIILTQPSPITIACDEQALHSSEFRAPSPLSKSAHVQKSMFPQYAAPPVPQGCFASVSGCTIS